MRKSRQDTSDSVLDPGSGLLRGGGKKLNFHKLLFAVLIILLPTQLGRHWWPQWSYVLGLRVDYLSPTIYLTDLLVVGTLGLWFWEGLKTPRRLVDTILRGGGGKKHWWIFAAFLFLIANYFFAQNRTVALYKFAKIIEFSLLGLYIARNHYQPSPASPSARRGRAAISYQLSLGVIYSSLIAITQFIRQASLNGLFYWLGERTFDVSTPGIAKAIVGGRLFMRPYATFPHPNVLAGFILVSLTLIAIRNTQYATRKIKLQNTSGGIKKVLQRLAVVLGIVALLISFSRSAWLVGLVVGLWWLMINLKISRVRLANQDYNDEKRDAWRPPPRWVNALLGGGALIITSFGLLLLFKLPFSTSEAISQRLQLTKTAIAMIKEFPLIGVGLNNFIVRLPDFWQTPEAIRFLQPVHNIFLLVAAEAGLVGLLIFLWFLILTYKRLLSCYIIKLLNRKNFKLFTIHYSLFTSLTAILLLGLFDHYFLTLQQTQLLFSLVLGLSWGVEKTRS